MLWNAAEFAERRCDARVAREFEIALPHELSDAGRLPLTRAFATDLSNRFGAAVDFAIHVPQGKSDERNIHAHVVMTTRAITADGIAQKTLIERENRWLIDRGLPTTQMQVRQIREAFAGLDSRHLLRAGLDRRVDHRSHLSRGLAIEPTGHMGVHAAQMKERGTGAIELTEIRCQKHDWQRQASIALATRRTSEALAQYHEQNAIRFADDRQQACADLVRDYLADLRDNPDQSRIALAHRRIDVRAINDAIREGLQAEGRLAKGPGASVTGDVPSGARQGVQQTDGEIVYRTVNGARAFAAGDRIVLLQNDRDLGVKKGMLGTVEAVEPDAIHLRLDGGSGGQKTGRRLTIHPKHYHSLDHGYATTIHKAQGATVDRSFVMASATMDRHLTYVAMTRHRHQATLYAGRDEFRDLSALTASLGRSGLKETTLDYTDTFAERRGLKEPRGEDIRQQRAMRQSAPRQTMEGQRQRMEAGELVSGELHHQHEAPVVPPPLIPAIVSYDRTIEEIARGKARPEMERGMDELRGVANLVYHDALAACVAIKHHVVDPGTDPAILARAIRECHDQFGALRGKSGVLGDSRERKEVLYYARSVASLVETTARTWERQLGRERNSETWKRERCDVVEVPALMAQSEGILTRLNAISHEQRPAFVLQMKNTPEGRQALREVNAITQALTNQFGTATLRNEDLEKLRLRAGAGVPVERIRQVAGLVERAHRAELVEKQKLTLGLTQSLGIRM